MRVVISLTAPGRRWLHAEVAGTDDALRLGWTVAEARGLCNPDGPRPRTTEVPTTPDDILPLRSQRTSSAALAACRGTAAHLTATLRLRDAGSRGDQLSEAVADAEDRRAWPKHRHFFFEWDAGIQDELTQSDEHLANAYLLGRGLAECYWGLGPDEEWSDERGGPTGGAPGFLLGPDRRLELTRMLGRLRAGEVHSLTPAAVSGSLEAWGVIVDADDRVVEPAPLRDSLYEQARRWYQLLVLRQDPTTLVRPYARLRDLHQVGRLVRLMWPQVLAGLLVIALMTWLLIALGKDSEAWLQPLVATGGAGLLVVGGLLARARNTAQLWATRLRQDAYTDLVAAGITELPELRRTSRWRRSRKRRDLIESAVRQRILTPSTPAPETDG